MTATLEAKGPSRGTATAAFKAALVGECAGWLKLETLGDTVVLRPARPMPRRCTIRPIGIFEHQRGFLDVNPIMGRLVIANGATDPVHYRPFTKDPQRTLRELYFPVEPMPEDDWPNSPKRWGNCQAVARAALSKLNIPWSGFPQRDLEELVRFVHRYEPLDGCFLYALAGWAHAKGDCIIEIGSFRGTSASIFAMALRSAQSPATIVSVDSHEEQPHNAAHVRLALQQIGEEKRLVQIPLRSDDAARLLRPGMASLIFIDGDHSHEQVTADFHNYKDLLAPGGLLLFHDYGSGDHNGLPETNPGVRSAVDQHVFPDKRFKPIVLAHTLLAFIKQ